MLSSILSRSHFRFPDLGANGRTLIAGSRYFNHAAAGRWDLHNAILRHGGFKAVAEQLGRVHGAHTSTQQLLQDPGELKEALLAVADNCGLEDGVMPNQEQLRGNGEHELLYVSIPHV
jgi:hypothetical protein